MTNSSLGLDPLKLYLTKMHLVRLSKHENEGLEWSFGTKSLVRCVLFLVRIHEFDLINCLRNHIIIDFYIVVLGL